MCSHSTRARLGTVSGACGESDKRRQSLVSGQAFLQEQELLFLLARFFGNLAAAFPPIQFVLLPGNKSAVTARLSSVNDYSSVH